MSSETHGACRPAERSVFTRLEASLRPDPPAAERRGPVLDLPVRCAPASDAPDLTALDRRPVGAPVFGRSVLARRAAAPLAAAFTPAPRCEPDPADLGFSTLERPAGGRAPVTRFPLPRFAPAPPRFDFPPLPRDGLDPRDFWLPEVDDPVDFPAPCVLRPAPLDRPPPLGREPPERALCWSATMPSCQ